MSLVAMALVLAAAPVRALDGLEPGMKAPAISVADLDGRRTSFASFPGAKAFLVVFWAGWSGKSAEILERAQKIHTAHGSRGLVVLGINVESPALDAEEVRSVKAQVGRLRLSFPVLLDRGLHVFHAYGVVAVPSAVLIGPDFTVLATLASYPIMGREEFFDEVEAAVSGRRATPRAGAGPAYPNARAARYTFLGRTLLARGQVDQAAANLQKAIEIDATFALPRVFLAQLWRERALARDAIQFQGETVPTLRIDPEERERLLREAEAMLEAALKLDPRHPAAMTELALVRRARGDAAGARALLERALAANADYPSARSHLGALLLVAGDTARGTAELTAAIQLNPVDWRLHITAAEAYEARSLTGPAVAAYRRGVELLWQSRRQADGER